MSVRSRGRTGDCDRADALQLLERSRSLVDAARLVVGDNEFRGVAAALSVLAGIAASDAACCAVLACRHRGQDHRGAVDLLAGVEPGGERMAKDLQRLLDRKDNAHYGVIQVALGEERKMIEWAARLLADARVAVET